MNAQSALLLIGGLLLLIAIVGGGIEVKELRVPKVERLPRAVCGGAGVVFVMLGLSVADTAQSAASRQTPHAVEALSARATSQSQSVIVDKLSSEGMALGQSEQATIKIDGNYVGHLTTSAQFPSAELVVTVAADGQHSFALEAKMLQVVKGKTVEVNCFGTGMIDVTSGSRFSFEGRFDEGGGPCLLWLEKV
jgi:hypothetical protein